MRPTLLVVLTLLSTVDLLAAKKADTERIARSRHYVVDAASVNADEATLAARGIEIAKPLADGRVLVRVAPGKSVDASFERLTAEKKIHRRALRSAAGVKPFAHVNILFHEGVDFDAARDLVLAAGGAIDDPLQVSFDVPNKIGARVPPDSLLAIAGDERVLIVDGVRKLRPALDNAASAKLHSVDVVQAAPYNLSGAGVVLSFFEFSPAQASHPEFQGRLTTHFGSGSAGDAEHATHVAGTMIAGGIGQPLGAQAKGMAPGATLHQFSARDDDFLNLKQKLRADYSSIADNNSWGYVLGWCTSPSCDGWVWDDTEEYYGYYDVTYVAPIDKITRDTNVLFVHSAGNDAGKRGPSFAPFEHKHTDDEGDIINDPARPGQPATFCYSANGSGTDCPTTTSTGAPLCSSGPQFCETVRHPELIAELPAPYGSIGMTASAKNSIAVGAIQTSKLIASFSSHGPARDGRIKPDVVARGVSVYSTTPNNGYSSLQGTSMASPAVAGMAALLTEQWRKSNAGADPKPATLKTLLIAGAEDVRLTDADLPGPDYRYGFGSVNVKTSVDLVIADGGAGRRVRLSTMANGGTYEVPLTVTQGQNVRVVLGWSDPDVVILPTDPIDTSALVNDLDVKVIGPTGTVFEPYVLNRLQPTQAATRGVNRLDNTEMVEIAGAEAGTYRVVVSGTRVTRGPQEFVVVTNSDMGASATPCAEINEPNDTEPAATLLSPNSRTNGATCAAGDADLFRFVVNEPGTISVTVTSTGTPLRVTLYGAATLASVDLGTNETRTVNAPYGSSVAATLFVRVEAIGAIGPQTGYTIEATYPVETGPRRRAARR